MSPSEIAALVVAFGAQIGRLFASGDELVATSVYFVWSAPALVGFAASLVSTFVLQALKRPILPMIAAFTRIGLLALVALGIGPWLGGGPHWVFAAFTAGCWLEGALDLMLLWRLLRDLPSSGMRAGSNIGYRNRGTTFR